jgi:hypothetical protein
MWKWATIALLYWQNIAWNLLVNWERNSHSHLPLMTEVLDCCFLLLFCISSETQFGKGWLYLNNPCYNFLFCSCNVKVIMGHPIIVVLTHYPLVCISQLTKCLLELFADIVFALDYSFLFCVHDQTKFNDKWLSCKQSTLKKCIVENVLKCICIKKVKLDHHSIVV